MMNDWLSLLVFAALFFIMMRYGCGAHLFHRREGGEKKPHANGSKDPVCGMQIGTDEGYRKMFQGHTIHFCSRSCLEKFDQAPEKYTDL